MAPSETSHWACKDRDSTLEKCAILGRASFAYFVRTKAFRELWGTEAKQTKNYHKV